MNAESLENQLVSAYDRGLLVPFLGAGMSHPACPLWDGFVTRLEDQAGILPDRFTSDPVERAARAVRRIRHDPGRDIAEVVRSVLVADPQEPPPQIKELARLHWPLVLSTNYDDFYPAAVDSVRERRKRRSGEMNEAPALLLGRSPEDCQKVLVALRRPEAPILWALQGYVGGQALAPTGMRYAEFVADDEPYQRKVQALHGELVVGHSEYRHVALASEPFRRAFAEVYRHRSLVFLGSGLSDRYFLDLFSEVIELHGPSPLPHFAFLVADKARADFLRQYFGIWVVRLSSHDELPLRLGALAARVHGAKWRERRWVYGRTPGVVSRGAWVEPELTVVPAELPSDVGQDGCIVVSAGGTPDRLHVSHVCSKLFEKWGRTLRTSDFERVDDRAEASIPIWRHKEVRSLLAVNARMNPWSRPGGRVRPLDPTLSPIGMTPHPTENSRTLRDIRLVEMATRQVVRIAGEFGYKHVHSMLLAAGGRRTFPRATSLMQMARGWARASLRDPQSPSLSVYVVDRDVDVLLDLQSGRLNLRLGLEPEVFEFWIEIHSARGLPERYLCCERADARLLDFTSEFDLESDDWSLQLDPAPTVGWANWTIGGVRIWERVYDDFLSLERFGLLPGSVLRVQGKGSPSAAVRGGLPGPAAAVGSPPGAG